ncbi:MAG: hypothetical protein V1855_03695, partial [bacterium]
EIAGREEFYNPKPYFKFAFSATMDFEEVVERKGIANPIIYEAQGGKIKKHTTGYVPDILLYIDQKSAKKIAF